ncbi:hypothetical protein NM688_g6476 [Phlebia brevispora]|uniref:Uncharacterized protein n=1 Tax=Phlebia brevispora TaxID=194682 RepID=A0ACC1SFS5_9APHY|nr:hypothetical protein NM688_g6476 [Phlebia brevispora]
MMFPPPTSFHDNTSYSFASPKETMAPTHVPTKQKALVLPEKQGKFVVREVDVPKPGPGEVLVRAEAVALNPVDSAIQATGLFITQYPAILGWEAAGTIVQLGEGVTSFSIGDKVLHPGIIGDGNKLSTYKQYNATPADLVAKIPANLSVDQAAAIPLTLDTAALGLYAKKAERGGAGLSPAPWEAGGHGKYHGQPFFVLGGASSVGQYAIQLARLSGFSPIIATASLKNADYLKSLGATHVIDRHLSPASVVADVKEITKEPIRVIYDTVSADDTQHIGYEVLASGGILVNVTASRYIPKEELSPDKHITDIFGSPFLPDRRQLSVGLYKHITSLFSSGELKASHVPLRHPQRIADSLYFQPNHIEVLPGGLAGIPAGLERLHKNECVTPKLKDHVPVVVFHIGCRVPPDAHVNVLRYSNVFCVPCPALTSPWSDVGTLGRPVIPGWPFTAADLVQSIMLIMGNAPSQDYAGSERRHTPQHRRLSTYHLQHHLTPPGSTLDTMSPLIPTKQKALVIPSKFAPFTVTEVDVPKPRPGELLVREEAVGLNPADWLIQESDPFDSSYPLTLGCEAAGVVVQLGEGVTSFAEGDKVFFPGSMFSNNPSFRQYTTAVAELSAKCIAEQVPSNLTLDQAASIPLAFDTACLGLYCPPTNRGGAGLTPPWEEGGHGKYAGQPILVLGGAAAIAQPAIQFARLSGFSPIITTASLRNTELLKSLGATHVVDRHLSSPDFAAAVKTVTSEPIRIVYDAVSTPDIQVAAHDLLAPGGVYVACTGGQNIPMEKRHPEKIVTFVFGSPFWDDRRAIGISMYKHIGALFESGDLKPNNIEVIPGGLAGIPTGLQKLKDGEVSAKKLVVHPTETV